MALPPVVCHPPRMSLLSGVLQLVFAPRCLGCSGATADARQLVCGRCRSRLVAPPPPLCPRCGFPRLRTGRIHGPTCQECQDWPPGLRAARAACLLRSPADTLVHELKYRGWRGLAPLMGQRMGSIALPVDVDREGRLVIPVPTTERRLRERGYNQAELLARAFARATDRTAICALRRGPGASSQTALQPVARLANVAGAFAPEHEATADIAGEHVVLVDDVLTTGATVTACTDALVAAGARCVSVITFARAVGRLRLD
jgi:ComF family protein